MLPWLWNQVFKAAGSMDVSIGGKENGFCVFQRFDRMKDYLISQGVASATINLGGNVLTIGSRPDGAPFRVGVFQRFDKGHAFL